MTFNSIQNYNDMPWLRPCMPTFNGGAGVGGWGSSIYSGWGGFAGSSSSSSSSSTDISNLSFEEYKKLKEKQSEKQKAEAEMGSEDSVKISDSQKNALISHEMDKTQKELISNEGSLLGTLAFGSLFSVGTIKRGIKVKQNKPIKEMFFAYDKASNGAKYANLYKDAPIAMQEAQEEMMKAHQQYQKQLKQMGKKGLNTNNLTKDYNKLQELMSDALKSGSADDVAKATEKIRAANGIKYKKLGSQTKLAIANAADVSKAKPVLGNNLKHHMGGKFGIAMSIISPIMVIMTDFNKIKAAYNKDTKTGLKQTGLSLFKGLASGATYLFADTFTKKFITSAVSKGAGKIAAKCAGKLATKGLGKIVGTALGSLVPIPGINFVLGALIGGALDWGVRKLLAHIENPGDKAIVENKTSEELLTEAYKDKKNGIQLDYEIEKALSKNVAFCAKIEKELAAEEAEQLKGQNQVAKV